MRVLLINEVCGTGSTGRICTDLALRIEKEGHEVKIAYGREDDVPKQYKRFAVRIGSRFDVMCHAALARVFDMAGFGSRYATIKFIKWVKAYNPDVIHLHNLHGYYINIEILFRYLRECKKRIVWTLHDCWAYAGHSAYCDVVQCERWKTGCYDCPQMKIYPKAYIDRSKVNWKRKRALFTNIPNLTVVCPSDWLAKQVKESYLGGYSIKIIHNSTDINVFHQLQNDFRDVWNLEKYFLVLGILKDTRSTKCEEEFVKLSQLIEDDTKIVLVGGRNGESLQNISSNIIYIPQTSSSKELACIYDACNVLFTPLYSDLDETVGAGAAACNLPMISYDNADEFHNISIAREFTTGCGDALGAIRQINELKNRYFTTVSGETEKKNKEKGAGIREIEHSCEGVFGSKVKYNLLGKKVLISVATVWNDLKGKNDLFDISKRLSDDCILLLVGRMDTKDVKDAPSNIIYIPKTQDKNELAKYYGMADLYINCTYCDTYPTVHLEAAACGTPIATYDVGGSTEIAIKTHGKCCHRGDIEGMLEAINSLKPEDYFKSSTNEKKEIMGSIDEYMQIYFS